MMINYSYILGFMTLITGVILFFKAVKRKCRTFICIIFSLIMMCMGTATVFCVDYDSFCAILQGITLLYITFKDKEPARFTGAYLSHLDGYLAGIMFLTYGLIRLFS